MPRQSFDWLSGVGREWISRLPGVFAHDTAASFTQRSFRGYNDDGDQSSNTAIANENTNWTQAVDVNFRVRFEVEETAGASPAANINGQLQYNLNAAGWNNVTASSSVVRSIASSNEVDSAACGNALTTSVLTFALEGTFDEADGIASIGAASGLNSEHCEVLYNITIRSADVANNDSVQLRVSNAGVAFASYVNTPSITVSEAAGDTSATEFAPTVQTNQPSLTPVGVSPY